MLAENGEFVDHAAHGEQEDTAGLPVSTPCAFPTIPRQMHPSSCLEKDPRFSRDSRSAVDRISKLITGKKGLSTRPKGAADVSEFEEGHPISVQKTGE